MSLCYFYCGPTFSKPTASFAHMHTTPGHSRLCHEVCLVAAGEMMRHSPNLQWRVLCWVLFWVLMINVLPYFVKKCKTAKFRTEELARKDCWQTRRFRASAHWTMQHLFKDYSTRFNTELWKPKNQKHRKYMENIRQDQEIVSLEEPPQN